MAKDKLISFFNREQTPEFDGLIEYKNPRLFTGNVPSYATHFCTDDESIASVYEEKGVERYAEVYTTEKSAAQAADSGAASGESQRDSFDGSSQQRSTDWDSAPSGEQVDGLQQEKEEQRQKEEVNWRDMAWPQMRAKAASLSDRPITSKAVAIEVLEEHLG